MNRKALSPLIATIMLVVFALIIGTATMKWGESFVKASEPVQQEQVLTAGNKIIVVDTPLKQLQLRFLYGEITEDEYLAEEKKIFEQE